MPDDYIDAESGETAIVKASGENGQADLATAKVQEGIAALKPKGSEVIAAAGVATVLPMKFYEGASNLSLTPEEVDVIKAHQSAPEDEIDIRPNDGLIYASHMWYRNVLTEAFGPGGWALVPASDLKFEKTDEGRMIGYRRWVLVVHGCYVGEAIGSHPWNPTNAKTDKSDTEESIASNALRRICAKSSLGIGSNVWNKRVASRWREKYCKQVWVEKWGGKKDKAWRRVDDEPLPGEQGDVAPQTQTSGSNKPPITPTKTSTSASPAPEDRSYEYDETPLFEEEFVDEHGNKIPDPRKKPAAKPVSSPKGGDAAHTATTVTGAKADTKAAAPAKPADVRSPEQVTPGQVRLFFLEANKRQLIVGTDGTKALIFLRTFLDDPAVMPQAGKPHRETIHNVVDRLTKNQFNQMMLKLRESNA